MKGLRWILLTVLLLAGGTSLFGQKKSEKDSLFRLVQAERAEQIYEYGINYRRVKGKVRFLHNDTYLLCDSASWNVDTRFIEAFGNVQIIQDKTMLKSETMSYWIDESRAVFQGGVVELLDKDGNSLRSERLTYNTKDSVGTFDYGGALKMKDGNVIESRRGTYDGKLSMFTFTERAEVFMDTIEMRTSELRYFTETGKAHFGARTYVWRDDGFLRSDAGWYDRDAQQIYFADHVYMFNPTYDAWADELYYNQLTGGTDLYNNAQVLDSTNQCVYLGDHISYIPPTDTTSERGLLTGMPALVYYGENENHEPDTLYARADSILVFAVPRCEISSDEVKASEQRLQDLTFDALAKKRAEEAEARAKQNIEKMRAAGKLPPEWVERERQAAADSAAAAAADSLKALGNAPGALDSLGARPDSLGLRPNTLKMPADSLAEQNKPAEDKVDTTAAAVVAVRDSTPVRHVVAWNHVRMFRNDIQAACDSLIFSELDSVARLYGEPVLWNEVRNQLTAEEMNLLMAGGALSRGNMVTDAWVISQQDSIHFNQIKSTEMLGWFRDNKLYRFDALGGVTAIFYMVDEDVVTTINVKESKSLTAALKDATAQRMLYLETIKSDVYPVGDLPPEKQRLKDFRWRGDERPVSYLDITRRDVKPSERDKYVDVKRPMFVETNKYFDNYIFDLFDRMAEERAAEEARKKAEQDSISRAAALEQFALEMQQAEEAQKALEQQAQEQQELKEGQEKEIVPAADTLKPVEPILPVADTLQPEKPVLAVQDTLKPAEPTLPLVAKETAETTEPAVASQETVTRSEQLTRAEKRALRRAERQARREARRAARAARRAERLAARQARKR